MGVGHNTNNPACHTDSDSETSLNGFRNKFGMTRRRTKGWIPKQVRNDRKDYKGVDSEINSE